MPGQVNPDINIPTAVIIVISRLIILNSVILPRSARTHMCWYACVIKCTGLCVCLSVNKSVFHLVYIFMLIKVCVFVCVNKVCMLWCVFCFFFTVIDSLYLFQSVTSWNG